MPITLISNYDPNLLDKVMRPGLEYESAIR